MIVDPPVGVASGLKQGEARQATTIGDHSYIRNQWPQASAL
jgi:hypothetical protein